ncbi:MULTISPECIES: hypothetical protein [unclassified Devosia]|uniref:hypothetical protein n=1 Tax=unclassified Devosia TaxID=196773 RepID=UPI001AD5DF32|nr:MULTISPECIES: hypothetical protein [unclassified Devosia]MBN9306807.1 hypothetical protein [Devosia sp.]
MKKNLVLLSALVLFASPAPAVLAVPMCDGPPFDHFNADGTPAYDEIGAAENAERRLRARGIDANMTRFWNGCIQTFVDDGSGHQQMKFYDYDSLRELR